MANRDDIIKQNIKFMYGRSQEISLQDPDKRTLAPTVRKSIAGDVIDSFDGENAFLSPGFDCPVMLPGDDLLFPSFEHALQASRTTDISKRAAIRDAKSARDAKKLGSKVDVSSNWKENCAGIAEKLLRDKFFRNKELKAKLLKTEHRTLKFVNNYGDQFWGITADGKGQNKLGKLLEKIRTEIEQGEEVDHWLSDHFKAVSEEQVALQVVVSRGGQKVPEECKRISQRAKVFIGKSESNDIVCNHVSVSRRHAVLLIDGMRGSLLIDLHAANGTVLNGQTLQPLHPYAITDDCIVSFGASHREYVFIVDRNAQEKMKAQAYDRVAACDISREKAVELTVFVGNIPFYATEKDIRSTFESCGAITDISLPKGRIPDGESTGDHRGVAFIRFATAAGVVQALSRDGDEMVVPGQEQHQHPARKLRVRRSNAPPVKANNNGNSKSSSDRSNQHGNDNKQQEKGPTRAHPNLETAVADRSPVKRSRRSRSPQRKLRNNESPVKQRRTSESPERRRCTSRSPDRPRRTSESPERPRHISRSPDRPRRTSESRERPRRTSRSPDRPRRFSRSPDRRTSPHRSGWHKRERRSASSDSDSSSSASVAS